MAKIITREWTTKGATGKRVRHACYGYTLMVNGKRERQCSSAWTTEDDAVQALNQRLQAVRAGRIDRPADVTFGALATAYLTYKTAKGKRSVHEDARILKTRLLPAFGATRPAREVNEHRIAAYEQRRCAEVSANTTRNELTILHHLLNLGRKWGYLDEVPAIEMPKVPEGRTRYLDEGEITRLLHDCEQSKNPYLCTIVVLAINCGLRKGELLSLRWERVDLSTDLGFSARVTLYETKNGRPRGVPLNTAAVAALTVLESDPTRRIGHVFRRRDGSAWGAIRTAFEKAVERAGLQNFRFHDLRHTCASHMVMRGRSLKEVQEVLGHRSFAMTLRYAHLSPGHLRTAVEALEGLTSARHTAANLDGMAHEMAQSGVTSPNKAVSSR